MFVLRAKSWQIFCILIAPLVLEELLPDDQLINIIVSVVFYFTIFGWMLLLGTNLNSILPSRFKARDNFFILNCFYLIITASIFSVFVEPNSTIEFGYSNITVVFPLYFLFAFFYVIHFIAKAIAIGERQRPVKIDDYKMEIILLLIFILGVWFLQPKINNISESLKIL